MPLSKARMRDRKRQDRFDQTHVKPVEASSLVKPESTLFCPPTPGPKCRTSQVLPLSASGAIQKSYLPHPHRKAAKMGYEAVGVSQELDADGMPIPED